MMLSRREAADLLTPYLESIQECIEAAWSCYRSKAYERFRPIFSDRTRANIVYDLIIDEAHRRFDDVRGVEFHEQNGLIVLGVGKEILLKFKKLDSRGLSRTYPTQQSLRFDMQDVLPGFPAQRTNLIVGYQLDDLKTEITEILVTCPYGATMLWEPLFVSEILATGIASPPQVALFPSQETPPALEEIGNVKDSEEPTKRGGQEKDG